MDSQATSHVEVERTFEADSSTVVPDLRTGPVTRVEDGAVEDLVATYHDTPDLRLLRTGVTLRRREGSGDAGWHVKVTAGAGRLELHRPLGRSLRPPVALLRLVRGATRDADVVPVAELRTQREERRLLGADGDVLAVVADDRVEARVLLDGRAGPGRDTPGAIAPWREVEIELVEGDTDLLDVLAERMHTAGLADADVQSKVRRILGDRVPAPATGPDDTDSTAGGLLVGHLEGLRVALVAHDVHVRARQPDAVHQLRVAARRTRSVLAAYRPLLDEDSSRALERALRRLGQDLAPARDLEVGAEQLTRLLADEQPRAAAAAARRTVRASLAAQRQEAARQVDEALGADRHRSLLDDLVTLVDDPPLTERAGDDACHVVRRRVRKARRRVARRMAAADQLRGSERDAALHAARKAAKRLRYALEPAEQVASASAERLRRRVKRAQQLLGSHQDTVVLRTRLEALARDSDDPAATFVLGRLHAHLGHRAQDLDAHAFRAWQKASRKKAIGWL